MPGPAGLDFCDGTGMPCTCTPIDDFKGAARGSDLSARQSLCVVTTLALWRYSSGCPFEVCSTHLHGPQGPHSCCQLRGLGKLPPECVMACRCPCSAALALFHRLRLYPEMCPALHSCDWCCISSMLSPRPNLHHKAFHAGGRHAVEDLNENAKQATRPLSWRSITA